MASMTQDAVLFLELANDQQEIEADERIRFSFCHLGAIFGALKLKATTCATTARAMKSCRSSFDKA